MPIEEAIEILNFIIEEGWLISDLDKCKAIDACELAIKALEQEPCEDVISRGMVIQTLNKMDRYTANELTLCDTDKKFPANEVFIVDDVYEEIAEQLPSVMQKSGKWLKMPIGFKCSNCNELEDRTTKYCPNCGCRMFEL